VEFQVIYGREYPAYVSSGRKSANLTIDKLSRAALNTQIYSNRIICSRNDTFSIYVSTTFQRRCLHQNKLLQDYWSSDYFT